MTDNGKGRFWAKIDYDWCHLCGTRTDAAFAQVDFPENAEHDKKRTRFLRVCETCVATMQVVINAANESTERKS